MTHRDYIIIGAGPAGLQMGHFLQRAGRSYQILEAGENPGAFFYTFPRHRFLISINKRFNFFDEAEFNLRHDWNSLLSDDESLLFKHYSEDLFPDADDLCRYLKDYTEKLSLDVRYGARVASVEKDGEGLFHLVDEAGATYACQRLLMATGTVTPRVPEVEGIELAASYSEHEIDPKAYENRRVAIIGRGNSAFEVANHLAGHAAIVHLLVGVPIKHAWQTHYPGDLRAINNTILDMYQLKSLHAAIGFVPKKIERAGNGSLAVTMEEEYPHWETPGTGTTTVYYDDVIHCIGWNYVDPSIFAAGCVPAIDEKGKYPQLSSCWESSVPDLYYIGTSMQARDRKAASAFIHGFRYNVQTLHHLMEERYHGATLPSREFDYRNAEDLDVLADFLIRRLSTTSALFQLFGFLCDVLVLSPGKAELYYELPVDLVRERQDFAGQENLVMVTLEYGFHRYPKDVATLDFIHPADATKTACSAYLHPVFRSFERGEQVNEEHLGESLVVRYDICDYEENLDDAYRNTVKNVLNKKLRLVADEFSEEMFDKESDVITPWTEEKRRKVEEQRLPGDAECGFVAWP